MAVVKEPFPFAGDGHTVEFLAVGDERDFGALTAGLVAAGLVETGKAKAAPEAAAEPVAEAPVEATAPDEKPKRK